MKSKFIKITLEIECSSSSKEDDTYLKQSGELSRCLEGNVNNHISMGMLSSNLPEGFEFKDVKVGSVIVIHREPSNKT